MSWTEASIESLCLAVTSGGTPSRSRSEYWENGTIPWLKTGELNDSIVHGAEEKITKEGLANSSAKIFPKNTVLMAMYGDGRTITTLSILGSESATNQACAALIANPEVCDYRFLFQALKLHRHKLLSLVVAGAQRNLSLGIVKRFAFPVPDLPTQQRIAGILSAYDDLIENNRRRIGLLEQAARLLYREWFVHLRFPGHETAKIVDGLPEGWERATLGRVADEVDYGFTASASLDVDGPRFLRITDIVAGAINWHQVPRCEIPEGRLKKFLLKEGDVVVARTGATTGWARRIGELAEQAVFASYLVRFRFGQRIDPVLAATFMESDLYKTTIQGRLGGAAQPNASAKVLAGVEIAVPPRDLQVNFKDQISETNRLVDLLMKENAKLTRARDLLLPRLMDGRISV